MSNLGNYVLIWQLANIIQQAMLLAIRCKSDEINDYTVEKIVRTFNIK